MTENTIRKTLLAQILIEQIGKSVADVRPDLNGQLTDEVIVSAALAYFAMAMDSAQFDRFAAIALAFDGALDADNPLYNKLST